MGQEPKNFLYLLLVLCCLIPACNSEVAAIPESPTQGWPTETQGTTEIPPTLTVLATDTPDEQNTKTPTPATPDLQIIQEIQVAHLFGLNALVKCMGFSSDLTQIAAGDFDTGEIVIFDLENWDQVSSFKTRNLCSAIEYSPNDKNLAIGYMSGGKNEQIILELWDLDQEIPERGLNGFRNIFGIRFLPEGASLVYVDANALQYDIATMPVFSNNVLDNSPHPANQVFRVEEGDYIESIIVDDGKFLVGSTALGKVLFWDFETGKIVQQIDHQGNCQNQDTFIRSRLKMSPDGTILVYGSNTYKGINIWNIDTESPVHIIDICDLTGPSDISPDNQNLVGITDNEIVILSISDGVPMCQLETSFSNFLDISFSNDGQHVFAITDSGSLVAWEIGSSCLSYK